MTLTLDLAPEAEALLRDIAEHDGLDKTAVASSLLAAALEHAVQEREAAAIERGLQDSLAGRVTPLAEWDARFRARHNIVGEAEPMSDAEAQALP